jgi:hypothetical protein
MQIGGNVTNLVRIRNHTSCRVRVARQHLGSDEREVTDVRPNGTHFGSMWVPWVRDWFADEQMVISLNGRPYFVVWQYSGALRFLSVATVHRVAQLGD